MMPTRLHWTLRLWRYPLVKKRRISAFVWNTRRFRTRALWRASTAPFGNVAMHLFHTLNVSDEPLTEVETLELASLDLEERLK